MLVPHPACREIEKKDSKSFQLKFFKLLFSEKINTKTFSFSSGAKLFLGWNPKFTKKKKKKTSFEFCDKTEWDLNYFDV